jgi:hypothetical protein
MLRRSACWPRELSLRDPDVFALCAGAVPRLYSFLSGPKVIAQERKVRSFTLERPDAAQYYFCTDKPFAENRVEYIGFRCPR